MTQEWGEDGPMTYGEWLENGRQVKRGETAEDWNEDGVAIFTFDQTVPDSSPTGLDADGTPYWEDVE